MKPIVGKRLTLLVLAAALGLGACSSNPNKPRAERPENPFKYGGIQEAGAKQVTQRDLKLEAGALYALARKSLESGDYADASLRYAALSERYPFTEYATQSQLERVYSLSKEFKPDEALSAADRFLREHPRHPRADYVQYLKGVINSEREEGLLESLRFLDNTKSDTTSQRRAFDEFAVLLQKYPASAYNADARQRMTYLRNRMASHDLHVVRYYLKRGAYLAAAKRAEQVVGLYPGAPATVEALAALSTSYRELGLTQQAADASALYQQQARAPKAIPVVMKGMSNRLESTPASDASAPAATQGDAPVPAKGPVGRFFSGIADVFSFADRSKSEPVEFVLPSLSAEPAEAAKPQATEASSNSDGKTTDTSAQKPENPNRLIFSIGEDEPTAAPEKKP